MSQDIVYVSAMGTIEGIEAFMGFVAGFWQAFPDLRFDIRNIIEGQDAVVAQGVFIGTNTGPMMGLGGAIPATGRKRSSLRFATSGRYRAGA
jgi:predicted ester cyclase